MTTYFSKEDRLTHVVKSIDSHILKRAGTALCRNSTSDRPNYSSSTNFSSFKPSRTRGRRTVLRPTSDIFSMPSPSFSPSYQRAILLLSLHRTVQTPQSCCSSSLHIVGSNEGEEDSSVLLHTSCSRRQMYCTEEC